ncbi:hypothetical protein NPIL_583491 [Nephila pilipes]|uniref:Uncharacterized protein n=1 Tax=Nephila pilipes TaxID=299642 RepID=A0A8X6QCM4_NEPPI|nr:hypothetical protein NPIL_583491 [Nephila pilipes]
MMDPSHAKFVSGNRLSAGSLLVKERRCCVKTSPIVAELTTHIQSCFLVACCSFSLHLTGQSVMNKKNSDRYRLRLVH